MPGCQGIPPGLKIITSFSILALTVTQDMCVEGLAWFVFSEPQNVTSWWWWWLVSIRYFSQLASRRLWSSYHAGGPHSNRNEDASKTIQNPSSNRNPPKFSRPLVLDMKIALKKSAGFPNKKNTKTKPEPSSLIGLRGYESEQIHNDIWYATMQQWLKIDLPGSSKWPRLDP